jgi:hypothetical protein
MIAPLLNQNPNLLHALEEAALKAQALLDRTVAVQACSTVVPNQHLLDRIGTFFDISENWLSRTGALGE